MYSKCSSGKMWKHNKPALISILWLSAQTKILLLLLSDSLGGMGKVPIVSEQSRDSTAKFSSSLFQFLSNVRVLMPFFVMFMYDRLNNSLNNHSQCLDFSQVFQIRLGIFSFFYLSTLMLQKCFHIVIVEIKAAEIIDMFD